ncbi:hypothetical protein BDV30DRAFT_233341 [Aspergillus minisclerotigenes]|uniref:Protein kinase domain-containing protein n=1 Tax=Aspergillus minisclerotigenes TaxID=656917 RepID=A0A5N6JM63_9EURO|nr:hypothetical protein BDV30DRAFT_233341 [Aspergillus minisclerotigenes]
MSSFCQHFFILEADSAIMITDFGEAFDPRAVQQFAAHTPLLLAPPESRFAESGGSDQPLSFPGDIWTLTCTIWDIFGSGPPFEAFPVTLDEVTIEHVEMLGRLPDRWWSKWEERSNWFDEDGRKNVKETLRQWYGNSARDWTQRFTEYISPMSVFHLVRIHSLDDGRCRDYLEAGDGLPLSIVPNGVT